ncbi:MAG: N-acetyltransferase [Rhizobium sp.]|nr:N-acetyltransferase [Rhizobium sp.]
MNLPAWREIAIDKSHDRNGFDCGQADLNIFLAQHARKAHENSISKTYVALDASDGRTIHGFYTLSPAQVDFFRVPELARPSGGRYPVGGFRLGRLAISKALQGQGLGGQLLVAAAQRCIRASAEIGGTALIIDAKDEKAAAWYRLYGAVCLHDAPLSLLLPYNLLKAALEVSGRPLA